MKKLRIESGAGWDTLKILLQDYLSVFMVYDIAVRDIAIQISDGRIPMYGIAASEGLKTMDQVVEICRWLMENGADRNALVLAVGGGITTDMAGFAASVYKRGIRYANVPTTLLCQADAGLGGKTGVNLDSYKNMIGTITQPEFTYICPLPLQTLPHKEMLSGLAEILKTFVIGSATLYRKTVREVSDKGMEPAFMFDMAVQAARIKARIVARDEKESGLRRVLNLGHTFAHAIEWFEHTHGVSSPYSHGQAVAIGMVMAAHKSEHEGIAQPGLAGRLEKDLAACGLPTAPPCNIDELQDAMNKDKKADGSTIHYVLIREIGKVTVV